MNAPPKNRWLHFSIRTMLVVTSAFCVLLVILIGAVRWQLTLRRNSEIVAARAQLSAFEMMLDQYRQDIGSYPNTEQGLRALRHPPSDLPASNRWKAPYAVDQIPPDPWGNPYLYIQLDAARCAVSSAGPDGIPGSTDDVRSASTK